MLSLISRLQRKPESVRRKIAFVVSAAVTGVIILFWLVSFGSSSSGIVSETVQVEKEPGPFAAFAENVGSFIADAAETIQAAAGVFSGISGKVETVENPASNTPAEK